jgi:hypothetical protein
LHPTRADHRPHVLQELVGVDSGVISSRANRYGVVIGAIGTAFFGVVLAAAVAAGAWLNVVVAAGFVGLGVIAIAQGLSSRIRFDQAGVRARPLPWRRVQLRWDEIDRFWHNPVDGQIYADCGHRQVPLLQFGRRRSQVERAQSAMDRLEAARTRYRDAPSTDPAY